MKLSGEATLNAPVTEVYAALNDPAVLVRTIPGCQRLEQVGPDSYKATVAAGVASIKGTFDGDGTPQRPGRPELVHAARLGAGAPGHGERRRPGRARAGRWRRDAAALRRRRHDRRRDRRRRPAHAHRRGPQDGGRVLRGRRPGACRCRGSGGSGGGSGRGWRAGPGGRRRSGSRVGPAPSGVVGEVWTRPAPVIDPARQRVRDLLIGAAFGAVVALLGVLVGAIVARW